MFNRAHAPESAIAEWIASLSIVAACAAFALLLASGQRPAMDRARLDASPAASATATASAPAPAATASTSGG